MIVVGPISIFWTVLIVAVLLVPLGMFIHRRGRIQGHADMLMEWKISELPNRTSLLLVDRLSDRVCVIRRTAISEWTRSVWRVSDDNLPGAFKPFEVMPDGSWRYLYSLSDHSEDVVVGSSSQHAV